MSRMMRSLSIVLGAGLALASPLSAQDMANASGGTLRLLDKISGRVSDLKLGLGQAVTQGKLSVSLDQCRYPKDNPAADAEAHVTVVLNEKPDTPLFSGWMIASSPALSAMDHPRYDIWVLSCDSGYVAPEVQEREEEDIPLDEINEG